MKLSANMGVIVSLLTLLSIASITPQSHALRFAKMSEGKVEPLVWDQLKGGVPVPIFVKFPGTTEVDMSGFTGPESQRAQYVYELRNKQLETLSKGVTALLDERSIKYRTFFIEPQVFIFEASEELVRELAAREDVFKIAGDRSFRI